MERERGMGCLTRGIVDALRYGKLVPSAEGPYGLVARGDGDDGEEGGDEVERGADVPLAEDDAQVVRVPGEEHLYTKPPAMLALVPSLSRRMGLVVAGIEGGNSRSFCT
jgi:hypothetical protein